MIFSLISIIVIILSMIIEKNVLNSQGHAMVEFDVTGSTIGANSHQFRNKTKQIRNQISNKLGLNERLIEILKPRKIPNGLRFTINIHLNRISVRDNDYEKLLDEAQKNGSLGEIFQNSWDLQSVPNVSNIEFMVNESKRWKENIVSISMDNQSAALKERGSEIDQSSGNNVGGSLNDYLSNNQRKSSFAGSMEEEGVIENIELAPMPQINETDAMINTTKGEIDDTDDSDVANENKNEYKAITPGHNNEMELNQI